ncbi:MAG: hypothetical protein AAF206_30755 [Bacteroidota bacterium]
MKSFWFILSLLLLPNLPLMAASTQFHPEKASLRESITEKLSEKQKEKLARKQARIQKKLDRLQAKKPGKKALDSRLRSSLFLAAGGIIVILIGGILDSLLGVGIAGVFNVVGVLLLLVALIIFVLWLLENA